jgi:hypothetical protein
MLEVASPSVVAPVPVIVSTAVIELVAPDKVFVTEPEIVSIALILDVDAPNVTDIVPVASGLELPVRANNKLKNYPLLKLLPIRTN